MRSSDDLLRLVRETVHHPATARELTRALRIPREEAAAFRRQLKALVASGDLLQIRGNRYGLPEKMDLVVGRLSTNAAGFGFVVPEHPPGDGAPLDSVQGKRPDVYIPAAQIGRASCRERVCLLV